MKEGDNISTVHKSTTIFVNGQYIDVDNEMCELIIELNRLGFKTSGCCIGTDDSAWVCIQETSDDKMSELMSALIGTEYILQKEFNLKKGITYTQYHLSTPNYEQKNNCKSIQMVNRWVQNLKQISRINIHQRRYKTMEELFV